jgi:Ca2+-binding RTX toxin-like protein
MTNKRLRQLTLAIIILLMITASTYAFAASIVVPTTRLTNQAFAITANALKPAECSAINLTNIVICSPTGGVCNGTNGNDLVLGGPSADKIQGKNGTDCLIGGGGDDDITGNNGSDVCIGGPGNDNFSKCMTTIQ